MQSTIRTYTPEHRCNLRYSRRSSKTFRRHAISPEQHIVVMLATCRRLIDMGKQRALIADTAILGSNGSQCVSFSPFCCWPFSVCRSCRLSLPWRLTCNRVCLPAAEETERIIARGTRQSTSEPLNKGFRSVRRPRSAPIPPLRLRPLIQICSLQQRRRQCLQELSVTRQASRRPNQSAASPATAPAKNAAHLSHSPCSPLCRVTRLTAH